MPILKSFPNLYAKSSNGKTKVWIIYVEGSEDSPIIVTKNGYLDAKMRESKETIREGLNIGKSNETSPLQQAISEAQSKWRKKAEHEYSESIDRPTRGKKDVILPMLAQKYSERSKYIKFPCYVQPKLNGMRMIARKVNDKVVCTSRGGKPINTVKHIEEQLLPIIGDNIYDGEIYKHGMIFQDIIKLAKKERPGTKTLEYHIYDVVDTERSFQERFAIPSLKFKNKKVNNLVEVPTFMVTMREGIQAHHEEFVQNGYEGTIIRNAEGLYTPTHRSNNLQKLKDFIDNEFEIIGGHSDSQGCVVFECITKGGKTFDCRPHGTEEMKKKWLKDIDKLKGKMLTVRYQSLSAEGKPTILTGLLTSECFRDYE